MRRRIFHAKSSNRSRRLHTSGQTQVAQAAALLSMGERPSKIRKVEKPEEAKITDSRFANVQNDPRYRLPSKKHRVKVDSRFARGLRENTFTQRAKVDRYGRPVKADSENSRLNRKYEFENEKQDEQSDDPDDDGQVQRELSRLNTGSKPRDILREGRETDSSSSSESDSSSEDEEAEEEFEEEAELAPQTKNEVPVGELSHRLAVVNMDWDNIRAEDLMAVFTSFPSTYGKLLKVAVYPSEFGRERMGREEMEGPPKEIFATGRADEQDLDVASDEDSDDEQAIKDKLMQPDDGTTDFDSQALRRYQLDRLRYFYAVLNFSSPQAAKEIYDAVDGTEYLSTANFFDLRFVPDDTDFSDDTPRDQCDSISTNYKPTEFITDALQHSKVKLTWDAEDTNRKEAAARAFRTHDIKDLDDVDLAAYIGSESSENESEADLSTSNPSAPNGNVSKKEADRQNMRSLLGLAPERSSKTSKDKSNKERAPVGNVEITFSAGLTASEPADPNHKRSVFENSPEELNETTIEKYVRKERDRKARRREKAKAARDGPTDALTADTETESTTTKPDRPSDPSNEPTAQDQSGFDDPFFFAEPSAQDATQQKNKLRKAERLKKRAEREAEDARNQQERAKLELLMSSNGAEKANARHFNMREIVKSEKDERKRNKMKKHKQVRDEEAAKAVLGESFAIDTADSRFKERIFGSHDFAVDPSNPHYGATRATEGLLEEGRKRRQNRHEMLKDGGKSEAGSHDKSSRVTQRSSGEGGDGEVQDLMAKIKSQSKSKSKPKHR